ncbi:MAG: penicillin acylase family protein [Polyangiales bacterium]
MKWVLAMLGVVAASIAGVYTFARRAVPDYEGVVNVDGLLQPLELVRDEHAIPHVFASTVEDAYFGLGFAHAQDRMLQLELARRLASGRLAEIAGEAALESDRTFRTLGFAQLAEANYHTLAADARSALDAYSAGVNAWLKSGAARPVELTLLGVTPTAWRGADSLLILKLMGWRLSGNWDSELWRLRLGAQLDAAKLQDFNITYPDSEPIAFAPLWKLYEELGMPVQRSASALAPSFGALGSALSRFAPTNFGRAVGSNNWAVDGSRSTTGKPLLANDPHLALSTPSQWYIAHLSAPELNVIGATIPGLPGVILGRNDHVAWAFTNTLPDTQDLYFEKPVDERYAAPEGARAFEQRSERIRVRGREDDVITVRTTRHGPVVSDLSEAAATNVPAGHVLALSWVGLRADDQTLAFPIRAARARDGGALRNAARSFHAPAQNIVYADGAGAIGFVAAGRIPLRASDNTLRGLVPSPGWLALYDWQGLVPFDELPQLTQPESGRIVTANQNILPSGYPLFVGADWGPPHRADRIRTLLDARPRHDLASYAAIQGDLRSTVADMVLEPMLAALGDDARVAGLRKWDHVARADAAEPLLFAAWLRELSRAVYEDELGPLFTGEWGPRPEFLAHVLNDASAWCDDIRTPAHEDCQARTRTALDAAHAYLRERFGDDPAAWRWGDAHRAYAPHPLFGEVPVLSSWFNVVTPRGGDGSTVDVGSYELIDDGFAFESSWGAGFRAIYDLADLERSRGIINSGQSAHVASQHYSDMAGPWSRGESVPWVTRRSSLRVQGTLRLQKRIATSSH